MQQAPRNLAQLRLVQAQSWLGGHGMLFAVRGIVLLFAGPRNQTTIMNPATSHVQNERLHLTLPTTAEFVDLKRKIWIRDGALNELRKMVRNLKDEANLQQQQHHRELCELRDRNREVEGRLEDVERQLIARTAERDRVTERWQQLRAPIRAIPNLLAMTPHNPPLELVGTHSENIGHEGAGCGGSNNADASADAGVGVMGSSLHDGGTSTYGTLSLVLT